jgi:hypothetical protein
MSQEGRFLRRAGWIVFIVFVTPVVVLATGWASLAIWYRLPAPIFVRAGGAGVFALLGLFTAAAMFTRWRIKAMLAFAFYLAITLGWWSTIRPLTDAQWAPDVARQVTGTYNGDLLTLTNVRNFDWRSDTDFTERWTTKTYDLAKVQGIDLFMSYWAGPQMAHMILSFGFDDGDHLAWSVEVRRSVGGEFSPIADLFKSNPLVIIAADERDVVGVRTNVRGEDVQLFRLKASPEQARALLLQYVADSNQLAAEPEFYNSITTNCTTTVAKMIRAVGDKVPFDWRLIANGYLPDYLYDHDLLDRRLSMSALRTMAHIDGRAKAAGLSPDFSESIRVGVPDPKI